MLRTGLPRRIKQEPQHTVRSEFHIEIDAGQPAFNGINPIIESNDRNILRNPDLPLREKLQGPDRNIVVCTDPGGI